MATTELIRGENMVIIVSGKAVGCARTCSLNTKVNIIGKSTVGSGFWKEYKGVSKEWSLTSDGLAKISDGTNNTFKELTDIKNAMDPVVVGFTVTDRSSNTYNQYGLAIIVELNASGSNNNVGVYNVTIQGTGPLAQFPAPEILLVVITENADPGLRDATITFTEAIITPLSYTIEFGLIDSVLGTATDVASSPYFMEGQDEGDVNAAGTWFRMKAIYADGESAYTEKYYPNV